MPPTGPSAAHARLLEQQAFLRRLAASLVADPHRAEDLAQDATLIALERPPAREGSMRAWLARVVRNRAVNVAVGEERRRARELVAAPKSLPRTPDEIEARFQVQRRVIEAVDRLQEPYRTTILLRYYHDLGPTAIAEQLSVPVSTVKSRLARGLAKLRADLDDSQPEGVGPWAVVLAGGLGEVSRPAAATALATGGIVMGAKLVVSAAAVGGALVFGGWWLLRSETGLQDLADTASMPLVTPQELSGEETAPLHEPPAEAGRAALAASEPHRGTDGAAAPPAWSLALELRGWNEGTDVPLTLEVRRGAEPEPALSGAHALAHELTLDVGGLFADVERRPGRLNVKLDHPAYLPAGAEVLVPQELLDPEVNSGRLPAIVDLVRAKATVTGTVEVPQDEPGVQTRVAIFPLRGDLPASDPTEVVRPNAEGHFRLRADHAEQHAIVALDARMRSLLWRLANQGEGPPLRPDTRVVTLAPGEERDLGVLVLDVGESIEGRVVGIGGSPPPPGRVSATLQDARRSSLRGLSWMQERFELTGQIADWTEDGDFLVPGLGPHAYELSAQPGDHANRKISMSYNSGEDDQVVTAPAAGVLLTIDRVHVTIEVLGEGRPLAGVALCMFLEREGEMTTFTDEEGRATLEFDPRQGLHVEARDTRYGSKELRLTADELLASDRFVIDFEGPPVEPAVLVVVPSVSDPTLLDDLLLELFLYETTRTPADELAYARSARQWENSIERAHLSPSGPRPTITREGATRVVSGIPSGTYFVRLLPQAAGPEGVSLLLDESIEVELLPGERVVHDWRPRLGGAVRLSFTGTGSVRRAEILDSDEQPVNVRYLSAGPTPDSRENRGSVPLAGVSVVRPALPPGDYLLRLHMRDRTTRTIPIQVEAGRVTDVEVDLGEL